MIGFILVFALLEILIVIDFLNLWRYVKKNDFKFYKCREFWSGSITLIILLAFFIYINIPNYSKIIDINKEPDLFETVIDRKNDFAVIDSLREIKDMHEGTIYVDDKIKVNFDKDGYIVEINFNIKIENGNKQTYYYANIIDDKLVFTETNEKKCNASLDIVIEYLDKYKEFKKDITNRAVTYLFTNDKTIYGSSIWKLEEGNLIELDEEVILDKFGLVIYEQEQFFIDWVFRLDEVNIIIV